MQPATTQVPRRRSQGRWTLAMPLFITVTCLHAAPYVVAAKAPSSRVAAVCVNESARKSYAPRGFLGYACRDDRSNSHKTPEPVRRATTRGSWRDAAPSRRKPLRRNRPVLNGPARTNSTIPANARGPGRDSKPAARPTSPGLRSDGGTSGARRVTNRYRGRSRPAKLAR